jgi:cytochrome c-type biogenesis protein CcmE
MTRKTRRLALIAALLLVVSGTAVLISVAFRSSITFFVTPSELTANGDRGTQDLRIGGLVEDGSLKKSGSDVRFRVTDLKNAVEVHYKGILPDLFREGQGVVAEGRMNGRTFEASQVLAKHDEKYMPPEAVEALKRAGEWHPETSRAFPASGGSGS